MVVRSVADGKLYIRKLGHPRVHSTKQMCSEVRMYRPHHQVPALIDWKDYSGPEISSAVPLATQTTATIWQFCNGGDLEHYLRHHEGLLPTAFIWHFLERMLNVLHFLHFQCNPPVTQYDFGPRNIFLHWDEHDKLPQVLLGDFGFAQTLDFDCRSGRTVWLAMRDEYQQLHAVVKDIIWEQEGRGALYPDSLRTFLRTMKACSPEFYADCDFEEQYDIVREKVEWLLNTVRTVSRDCIAVYHNGDSSLRDGAIKMPSTPDLAASADLMQLMHPFPIGPSKIVEVDPKSFDVLAIRREVQSDGCRHHCHGHEQ